MENTQLAKMDDVAESAASTLVGSSDSYARALRSLAKRAERTVRKTGKGIATYTAEIIKEFGTLLAQSRRARLFLAITACSIIFTVSLFAARTLLAEEPKETGAKVRNEKNTNGFFENTESWFQEGDALTTFSPEMTITGAPEVGYYKEHEEKREEPEMQEGMEMQPAVMPLPGQTPPKKFDAKNASAEQIVQEFGNPLEEAPMNPVESAPTPFKGLMAAMDSGNEDLAFQYARQYVRHIKNVQNRSRMINNFTDIALEREGMKPAQTGSKNPYRYLLEKDYEKSELTEDPQVKELDSRAQAILRKAEVAEAHDVEEGTSKIPVDPKGEIEILFFFKPGDPDAAKMAQTIEALYGATKKNPKVTLKGFSVVPTTAGLVEMFHTVTKTTFPIQEGKTAAERLRLVTFPTLVFLTKNTFKAYVLPGVSEKNEIVQVIRTMRGGK